MKRAAPEISKNIKNEKDNYPPTTKQKIKHPSINNRSSSSNININNNDTIVGNDNYANRLSSSSFSTPRTVPTTTTRRNNNNNNNNNNTISTDDTFYIRSSLISVNTKVKPKTKLQYSNYLPPPPSPPPSTSTTSINNNDEAAAKDLIDLFTMAPNDKKMMDGSSYIKKSVQTIPRRRYNKSLTTKNNNNKNNNKNTKKKTITKKKTKKKKRQTTKKSNTKNGNNNNHNNNNTNKKKNRKYKVIIKDYITTTQQMNKRSRNLKVNFKPATKQYLITSDLSNFQWYCGKCSKKQIKTVINIINQEHFYQCPYCKHLQPYFKNIRRKKNKNYKNTQETEKDVVLIEALPNVTQTGNFISSGTASSSSSRSSSSSGTTTNVLSLLQQQQQQQQQQSISHDDITNEETKVESNNVDDSSSSSSSTATTTTTTTTTTATTTTTPTSDDLRGFDNFEALLIASGMTYDQHVTDNNNDNNNNNTSATTMAINNNNRNPSSSSSSTTNNNTSNITIDDIIKLHTTTKKTLSGRKKTTRRWFCPNFNCNQEIDLWDTTILRCTNKLRGTNQPCDYFKPTTMPIRKVDKTFCCEICGKWFKQKNDLKVHTITHGMDRPYPCEYASKGCKLRFKNSSNASKHQKNSCRFGPRERRHKCPQCYKCYARKQDLKDHIQNVHVRKKGDPKACPCPVPGCPKAYPNGYANKANLSRHIKSVHK